MDLITARPLANSVVFIAQPPLLPLSDGEAMPGQVWDEVRYRCAVFTPGISSSCAQGKHDAAPLGPELSRGLCLGQLASRQGKAHPSRVTHSCRGVR